MSKANLVSWSAQDIEILNMKFLKIFICVFSTFFIVDARSQSTEIYGPFLMSNPDRIERSGNYCKNQADERKLWMAINRFSKSVLAVFPQIPPEQDRYIEAELNSKNMNRIINIRNSSIYRVKQILTDIENVEKLSAVFIENQNKIGLQKKMEFIGRTLLNLDADHISYGDGKNFSNDLKSKNYHINSNDLDFYWVNNNGIRQTLIFYLICHGTN